LRLNPIFLFVFLALLANNILTQWTYKPAQW